MPAPLSPFLARSLIAAASLAFATCAWSGECPVPQPARADAAGAAAADDRIHVESDGASVSRTGDASLLGHVRVTQGDRTLTAETATYEAASRNFKVEGDVEYAVAMGKNSILLRRAGKHMTRARRLSKASGQTEHVYSETLYATKSWPRKRRVIIKAEVTRHPGRDPKDNPRFVVTNMTQTPRWVYEKFYCQRGEIENRIKELHHGLEIDRTSCSRFLANQLRVLLTAAAYVLMQELRLRAAGTKLARAQVSTLRDCLLKIGARVNSSVRRIVLHLPESFPFGHAWATVAQGLGASPG